MRHTYLVLIFLSIIPLTYSQVKKTYSISGYVQDKETGEKLIGCFVFDSEKNRGIQTNSFGYFNIGVNEGSRKITAHYLGYNDESISIAIKNDTAITIKLTPSQPFKLDEVRITSSGSEAKLSRPQTGLLNLNSKDVKRLPSFLGESDVMRAIQALPGIQAANERSTGISVRGGSIDQNLFLLDDAPVFQISHMMEFFSLFNNNAIKDIKVYKGDIPANYGGRLSSLVVVANCNRNLNRYRV